MGHIRQIQLSDILSQLPRVEPLHADSDGVREEDAVFLCALGFEERCLSIPELLARTRRYRFTQAIYFEYATNVDDNQVNKPRLLGALRELSAAVTPMSCDDDDFPASLRTVLSHVCAEGRTPSVVFDISVCTSRLLLLALSVVLQFDLSLRIVYSEANVYHPTREEYESDPDKWTTEEGFGLARGVSAVTPSAEHPGSRRDMLQEVIIVFPTFKPERAAAIIAEIDESLVVEPKDRVVWIVGKPHLEGDSWRAEAVREINKIPASAQSYEISTFSYEQTLQTLERIYEQRDCKYHVTLAPLGSKMQSVGIALFCYIRHDVSVVFATPKEYNARQYSDGCKAVWQLDLCDLVTIRQLLDQVGQLQIVD